MRNLLLALLLLAPALRAGPVAQIDILLAKLEARLAGKTIPPAKELEEVARLADVTALRLRGLPPRGQAEHGYEKVLERAEALRRRSRKLLVAKQRDARARATRRGKPPTRGVPGAHHAIVSAFGQDLRSFVSRYGRTRLEDLLDPAEENRWIKEFADLETRYEALPPKHPRLGPLGLQVKALRSHLLQRLTQLPKLRAARR